MVEVGLLLDAGIELETLSQVEALAEVGDIRARIVIFGADSPLNQRPGQSAWGPAETTDPVRVFYLPKPRGIGTLDALSLMRSKALAGCDLLHCFSLSLLKTLAQVPMKKMLPGCCVNLSHWPGEEIIGQLRRLAKSPAVRVICHSRALQEAVVEHGMALEQCPVVEPGLTSRGRIPDRSAARRELDLPENIGLLLADPEISRFSNHRQLTWAAAIIGQFNPKLRVLVSGEAEQVKRLREFDDSLNPPSLGIYTGGRFSPEVLYAAADLLVLPATKAVSPLPLFRAAQARLPVVASNSPGFREYLGHKRNALLFGPGPHNAGDPTCRRIRPLATAIVRLLEDRKLARQLADRLAKDIDGRYTAAKMVSAELEIYQQILACGQTPVLHPWPTSSSTNPPDSRPISPACAAGEYTGL